MTIKTSIKNLVVILPEIIGSFLRKKGKNLWNISAQAIWQVLTSLDFGRDKLKILKDAPPGKYSDDDMISIGVIQNTH